jgi:poly(3-hydroxybutyrate) depolymerase
MSRFKAAALLCAIGCAFAGCSENAAGTAVPQAGSADTIPATKRIMTTATSLTKYNLNLSNIASAGVSSGGAMATQFHYAHSANVKYEAQIAGAPYYCSQDSLVTAENCQLGIFSENLQRLESQAVNFGNEGLIDPTSDLAGSKGYFYSGTHDDVVAKASVQNSEAELQYFGGTTIDNYTTPSGHGWISPNGPVTCALTESPFINNCGIDPEQAFLSYFYGTLNAKATTATGSLIEFNQNTYAPGGNAAAYNLDPTGYVFVPNSCAGGAACNLIVVFTGCLGSTESIGTQLMTDGNVDNWADTNNMVVLYPQLGTLYGSCWDFYGYTGSHFAFKSGPQIQTVWNMVEAL